MKKTTVGEGILQGVKASVGVVFFMGLIYGLCQLLFYTGVLSFFERHGIFTFFGVVDSLWNVAASILFLLAFIGLIGSLFSKKGRGKL